MIMQDSDYSTVCTKIKGNEVSHLNNNSLKDIWCNHTYQYQGKSLLEYAIQEKVNPKTFSDILNKFSLAVSKIHVLCRTEKDGKTILDKIFNRKEDNSPNLNPKKITGFVYSMIDSLKTIDNASQKQNFKYSLLRSMLGISGNNNNIMHHLASLPFNNDTSNNEYNECTDKIIRKLEDKYDKKELKEIISDALVAQNKSGLTPLHIAAQKGNIAFLSKIMQKYEISFSELDKIKDNRGISIVDELLLSENNIKDEKFLKEFQNFYNTQDDTGRSILQKKKKNLIKIATKLKNLDFLKTITPDSQIDDGIIFEAICNMDMEIINILLQSTKSKETVPQIIDRIISNDSAKSEILFKKLG